MRAKLEHLDRLKAGNGQREVKSFNGVEAKGPAAAQSALQRQMEPWRFKQKL